MRLAAILTLVCTLSWHRSPDGYRVFFNRDERTERRPGIAPALRERGSTRFLAPLDGDFGGTWIAASERGLTLCLLNGTPMLPPEPAARRSRGELPLALIDSRSTAEVRTRIAGIGLAAFHPFVLVGFDPDGSGLVLSWQAATLAEEALPDGAPLVSSSFSTEEVRAERIAVYRSAVGRPDPDEATELHLRFHESHLPRRGPHSVCMHREDASTVSFTWVEIGSAEVRMRHVAGPPCGGRPAGSPLRLARAGSGGFRAA
jgi:hypothetical protein